MDVTLFLKLNTIVAAQGAAKLLQAKARGPKIKKNLVEDTIKIRKRGMIQDFFGPQTLNPGSLEAP